MIRIGRRVSSPEISTSVSLSPHKPPDPNPPFALPSCLSRQRLGASPVNKTVVTNVCLRHGLRPGPRPTRARAHITSQHELCPMPIARLYLQEKTKGPLTGVG